MMVPSVMLSQGRPGCLRNCFRVAVNNHQEGPVSRLSKLARGSASHRALLAAVVLGTAGVLATAALASTARSTSTNWSTVQSAAAGGGKKALIKAAKKEGTLNVIALPTNWANYGKELNTFHKLYGIKITSE